RTGEGTGSAPNLRSQNQPTMTNSPPRPLESCFHRLLEIFHAKPLMQLLVGIEIGGSKHARVVHGVPPADGMESTFLEQKKLMVEAGEGAAGICQQIEQELPKLIRRHSLAGIGVGFGGPVDWSTGKIARSHQIEGWSGFDLAGWLRQLMGVPVAVDNDANV